MHPAKLSLFLASFAGLFSLHSSPAQEIRERTPVRGANAPVSRPSAGHSSHDFGGTDRFGSIEGSQRGDGFGWALQTAGDVNDDRFSDVLVTAPFFDQDFVDEGAAWLFLGTAEGLSPTPIWFAFGGQEGARFGFSAGTAGDVDGNGLHDLVIGAPGFDLAGVDQGAAFIFLSAPAGVASDPSVVLSIASAGAAFGTSVAWAGDVDRDGFDDVLAGAPGFESAFEGEGAAFLFKGSAAGTSTTPAWTALGGQALAGFGQVVAPAGDIDADGFADLLVGAPLFDGQGVDEGRVSVFAGSAGGPSLTPSWTLRGDQPGAELGASAMTAGDVDGDGFADVIVGAPGRNGGEEDEGRALLHRGSARGPLATPAWMVDSGVEDGRAGASVATAGDVNGDGYADVLVGIPGIAGSPQASGAVHAFHGTEQGLPQEPDEVWLGSNLGARLGHAVASAGDLDGNGWGDVILGAPMPLNGLQRGSAVVILGRIQFFKPEVSMEFPQGFQLVGDVNGDGYRDYSHEDGLHLGTPAGPSEEVFWSPDQVGASWAAVSDFNDDGYDDITTHLRALDYLGYCDETDPYERVFVHYSSQEGFSNQPHVEIVSPLPCVAFQVEASGDFDGDGFDDLIVSDGRPYYNDDRRMYLYPGGPPPMSAAASWQVDIPEHGFGALPVDADGDGRMDLVFAVPYQSTLLLVHGSTTPPTFIDIVAPTDGFFGFEGPWVLEDVDGDGLDEFGVFNRLLDDPFYAVYPARYDGRKHWRIEGHFSFFAGGFLSRLGDINADGFSDFIADYDGLFILGSPDGGQVIDDLPDFDAEYAGDVNGDGFLDVISFGRLLFGNATRGRERAPGQVRLDGSRPISFQGTTRPFLGLRLEVQGLSGAGRERVQLEWQIQRFGHPFEQDTRRGSPWIDTGLPGDRGSRVLLSEAQEGLNPGEIYKWRLRTISPHPFFPRSPWISLPHNNVNQAKFRAFGDGDCNLNGIPDAFDVIDGVSADCEGNGIPDECQAGIDCNGNGQSDSCDLASSFSLDCNLNFLPDDCELLSGDARDCDLDGLLDECEISAGSPDCNLNGVPDDCDVSSGSSRDDNADGVPDECPTSKDADRANW